MNDEWSRHREAMQWDMQGFSNEQLREIAIYDRDPSKRVAAIEELVRRLKA